jgi:ATP-binding cassette subfamily B protein
MGFTRASGPANLAVLLMWLRLRNLQNWINTLDPAKGPPPRVLMQFINWCLLGSYIVLGIAALASISSGFVETLTAVMLGIVLDVVLEIGLENLFSEQGFFLIGPTGLF